MFSDELLEILDVLNSWKLPFIVTVCVQFSTDATCAGVYIPLVAVKTAISS